MNIDMIQAAAQRVDNRISRTPVITSPFIDERAGRRVWIKAECLQHTRSFKFRGAWSAISALAPDIRAKGVMGFSSGNHGQALARVANIFEIPSLVVMPSDAAQIKINNTRQLGAEIILYERNSENREQIGADIAKERGMTLIKPFDDPEVIAGQGTTGLEIADQTTKLGLLQKTDVLVCCGGGGLISGIALALEAQAPHLRVRSVEPEHFDDIARSLQSGERKRNTRRSGSHCDAILTPEPGKLTFPIMQRLCRPGLVVSDVEALQAMVVAYEHLGVIVEPGGAVALAAALYRKEWIHSDDVICILTGGNVDSNVFTRALEQFGTNA